ncbi:MAG: 30S ribosomal protein S17 [Planctomycetota bacterium]
MSKQRKAAKTVIGTVTSASMDKTIAVQTVHRVQHELYRKTIRTHQMFKAHDENNEARVGARVRIAATRPLSKTKRWRLVEILEQGHEE